MGYSLIIGEAVIESEEVDPNSEWCTTASCEYLDIWAEPVQHDDAPAFNEPTDYTNGRWPSYTAWYDFCQRVGLLDAFYVERYGKPHHSMRGGHPGAFPITETFKKEVDEAYNNWKTKYPNVVATYDSDNDYDKAMCRLEWLKYWTDWALENCKQPVFANR